MGDQKDSEAISKLPDQSQLRTYDLKQVYIDAEN